MFKYLDDTDIMLISLAAVFNFFICVVVLDTPIVIAFFAVLVGASVYMILNYFYHRKRDE